MKLRFYYLVATSIGFSIRMIIRTDRYMSNPEKYDEEKRYHLARKIMNFMRRRSMTKTIATGLENLPEEGGYIMYANHQGKYDALGIFLSHKRPAGVLMEKKMSLKPIAKQMVDLVDGKRLDLKDPKQQIGILKEIAEEVKAGRRFLIFPEGGYGKNHNTLQKFNSGCFRCSMDSKAPIVPIAIVDSYKSMNTNSFKPCVTQVHFLPAIPYSEFEGMRKNEISDLVKARIQEKLDSVLNKNENPN